MVLLPHIRLPSGQTWGIQNTDSAGNKLSFVLGEGPESLKKIGKNENLHVDVFFPIVHGPNGEDGTLQGLLTLMNIPFVGPNTIGSALGMDKDVMKKLFLQAGIPTARSFTFTPQQKDAINYEKIIRDLGTPLFIKPANLGSSVGISKAANKDEFTKAIEAAFRYDRKVIVEENINGREIECSVMGNEELQASIAGEVIPKHSFYSYEAKYIDEKGADLVVPAKLDDSTLKKIQEMAVRALKTLECESMARADMFLTDDGKIYVNEINTLPGFTSISMYPKLWEESGIKYTDLITKLVDLALLRHERDQLYRKNNAGL